MGWAARLNPKVRAVKEGTLKPKPKHDAEIFGSLHFAQQWGDFVNRLRGLKQSA